MIFLNVCLASFQLFGEMDEKRLYQNIMTRTVSYGKLLNTSKAGQELLYAILLILVRQYMYVLSFQQ